MTKDTWNIKMVALSTTKKTPIMLSSHVRIIVVLPNAPKLTKPPDLLEPRRLRQSRHPIDLKPHAAPPLLRPAHRRRQHPHPRRHYPTQQAVLSQRLLVRP